jgi:hypothetical protein
MSITAGMGSTSADDLTNAFVDGLTDMLGQVVSKGAALVSSTRVRHWFRAPGKVSVSQSE